ncbi:MAG: DEAD/DEAH box helicase [Thaumarchaeota archaeon]|nr:DEAD/DEAH box helicase [Nitrososphaerota archaeon]MDE0525945.1 DEAD/DEAH box helicase [Nitrososphaerota archaeon]
MTKEKKKKKTGGEPGGGFRVSELGAIPASARKFLESRGFVDLYPPQAAAVEAGLLDGRSLLVSAPTASGKTLVATLAILSHLARGGGRVVYLSPLRALAAEKYDEFAALSGVKVSGAGWRGRLRALQRQSGAARADAAITTARLTGERGAAAASRGPVKIDDADIVVATNEAMDAAMRRGREWTQEIGLMIIDEIHLIGDESRGPTLEMILTQQIQQQEQQQERQRQKRSPSSKGSTDAPPSPPPPAKMQIVGLSATVSNDEEIAKWLGCMLVRSTWRPVPLAEGVCDEAGSVMMNDGRRFEVGIGTEGMPARLGIHAVSEGGQSLVFAATRASARATAVKASKRIGKLLSDDERRALGRISSRILPARLRADAAGAPKGGRRRDGAATAAAAPTSAASATTPASPPTELEKDLATLVSTGVAFHHAGLSERLRGIVESEFRRGSIRLLASTPTLAAGVNLPARRVVIASVSRYDARYGYNRPISVLEYKQLCGRAGRPQYDKYGEAVISATGPLYELLERYVDGEPEPLESGIMAEKAMRTHLLTVAVLNPGIRQDDLQAFFSATLGGLQYPEREVEDAVGTAVEFLLEHGMIVSKGGRYAATSLGRRTSGLYVDPVTASYLRNVAEGAPRGGSGRRAQRHTLGFLHAVISCDEFNPRQDLLKNHYHFAESLLSGPHRPELLSPVYAEECSRSLLVLHDWMNERTDREIETAYKTQSGDLHRMTESAAWLAYVMREMARDAGRDDLLAELATLRTRLRSGIKEELVELASIRGVGRVRARAIYDAGLRGISDIRAASPARLATIRQIGPTVAESIMRSVSGKSAGYGRRRAP